MARYTYMILSRAKPGREEDFRRWYAEQHLPDVLRQPGVVSGRTLAVDLQKVYGLEAPDFTLMTAYELETDDPAALMEAIRSKAGSPEMPMTDALDRSGMVQVMAYELASG